MKKIMLIIMALVLQTAFGQQKIAYLEVDKILEKMPEFILADNEIESQVKAWEKELDTKYDAIEDLYQNYVVTEANLTPEQKKQKQDEIFSAEQQANALKETRFGNEGDLFKLQESKLKPLYDKIYSMAETLAKEEAFDYVFEKSSESTWIYTNPEMNLTGKIIQRLGLEN